MNWSLEELRRAAWDLTWDVRTMSSSLCADNVLAGCRERALYHARRWWLANGLLDILWDMRQTQAGDR